jgi:cell division protein FtsB
MPIRYITNETRSAEQAQADDRIREDVESSGGIWSQLSAEQRAHLRARLHDKQQRAQAARATKQAEQEALEERVRKLEERVAKLGG